MVTYDGQWQDVLVRAVRNLIGDTGETVTYSDDRIAEVIILSGLLLRDRIDFDHDYTFDVNLGTISPDPIEKADDTAILLLSLKAACWFDTNLLRSRAMVSGIRSKLGPSQLETFRHIDGFETLIKHGPCKMLDEAIMDVKFGNNRKVKAIVSSFTSNDFDPNNVNYAGNRTRSIFS